MLIIYSALKLLLRFCLTFSTQMRDVSMAVYTNDVARS